jgi:hypothetical protein
VTAVRLVAVVSKNRRFVGPRKVNPTIGGLPYIVTLHDRLRFFINHCCSSFGNRRSDKIHDRLEGVAGVSHIVDDEDSLVVDIDEIELGRKHHGKVESLIDAAVVLNANDEDILDRQRIAKGTGGKEPAPSNGQDNVGYPPGIGNLLGELTATVAKGGPGQNFTFGSGGCGHGPDRIGLLRHGRTSAAHSFDAT